MYKKDEKEKVPSKKDNTIQIIKRIPEEVMTIKDTYFRLEDPLMCPREDTSSSNKRFIKI